MPAASATDVRTSSSERPARATSARSWLSSAADWRNDTSAAALAVRSASPAGRRVVRAARRGLGVDGPQRGADGPLGAGRQRGGDQQLGPVCVHRRRGVDLVGVVELAEHHPPVVLAAERAAVDAVVDDAGVVERAERGPAPVEEPVVDLLRGHGRERPSLEQERHHAVAGLAGAGGHDGRDRCATRVGQQQQEGVVLDPLARVHDEPTAAVAVPEEPPQEHGELVVPLVAAHHADADAVAARGDGLVHPLGPPVDGLGDGAEVGEVGLDVAGGHRAHRRAERVADQGRDREAEEHRRQVPVGRGGREEEHADRAGEDQPAGRRAERPAQLAGGDRGHGEGDDELHRRAVDVGPELERVEAGADAEGVVDHGGAERATRGWSPSWRRPAATARAPRPARSSPGRRRRGGRRRSPRTGRRGWGAGAGPRRAAASTPSVVRAAPTTTSRTATRNPSVMRSTRRRTWGALAEAPNRRTRRQPLGRAARRSRVSLPVPRSPTVRVTWAMMPGAASGRDRFAGTTREIDL